MTLTLDHQSLISSFWDEDDACAKFEKIPSMPYWDIASLRMGHHCGHSEPEI